MNLKEAMLADRDKVFLNPNEFAEKHTLDGEEYDCIVMTNGYVQSSGERLGVYVQKTTVIINQDYIPEIPVEGQRINLDGSYLYVEGCDIKSGILNIILSANQAY
jgi:hypothetical protein